jgi:hypothetical protein
MLYVAAASYIFKNEAQFFYKQEQKDAQFEYAESLNFNELNIPVHDELSLHALWLKNPKRKGVVLYLPDGEYISGKLSESALFYYNLSYDIIVPEYRGNGKSIGKYETEEDLYFDAHQWLKMANGIANTLDVVIVGQGFGAGLAAQAYSSNSNADLLILENPYRAWNDVMLRKYFWWLPHSYFTNFEIPTWEYLRASSGPIVLIHPTDSKSIKFKNSELLLEYLKPGDILISLQGETIDYQSNEFLNKFEKVNLP